MNQLIYSVIIRNKVTNGFIRSLNNVRVVMGIMSQSGVFLFSLGDNGLELEVVVDMYGNEMD